MVVAATLMTSTVGAQIAATPHPAGRIATADRTNRTNTCPGSENSQRSSAIAQPGISMATIIPTDTKAKEQRHVGRRP